MTPRCVPFTLTTVIFSHSGVLRQGRISIFNRLLKVVLTQSFTTIWFSEALRTLRWLPLNTITLASDCKLIYLTLSSALNAHTWQINTWRLQFSQAWLITIWSCVSNMWPEMRLPRKNYLNALKHWVISCTRYCLMKNSISICARHSVSPTDIDSSIFTTIWYWTL